MTRALVDLIGLASIFALAIVGPIFACWFVPACQAFYKGYSEVGRRRRDTAKLLPAISGRMR